MIIRGSRGAAIWEHQVILLSCGKWISVQKKPEYEYETESPEIKHKMKKTKVTVQLDLSP